MATQHHLQTWRVKNGVAWCRVENGAPRGPLDPHDNHYGYDYESYD